MLPDYFLAPALAAREIVAIAPGAKRRASNPILLAARRGAVPSARVRALREALTGAR